MSIKLGILSRSRGCYSTRRLREAAEHRGHKVKVLDTLRFSIDLERGEPDLYYRSKQLSHYDAVIPRIGASITYFGTAVVRQFEQMDVFTAASSAGIGNSRDKLRCLQILSRHQLGIPETTFVREKRDVLPAIERVGGVPIIIKLLEGTQGVGVIWPTPSRRPKRSLKRCKARGRTFWCRNLLPKVVDAMCARL